MRKKELASGVSNPRIHELYNIAMENGAAGGKLLGAGGVVSCYFIVKKINKRN